MAGHRGGGDVVSHDAYLASIMQLTTVHAPRRRHLGCIRDGPRLEMNKDRPADPPNIALLCTPYTHTTQRAHLT